MLAGLGALTPPPPPSAIAVVAARDLAAGVRLTSSDLRTVRVARPLIPTTGALIEPAALGEVLAAPMRAGQVLTDRSVIGPSLLAGYAAGTVATAIRLPDADIAALLHTGDRVDVYSSVADVGEPATLVAAAVAVIAVPEPNDEVRQSGAVVVLAATPDQSARLAGAATTAALSIDIRP
ncbi:MAG TPA: SAF domain-containing protein [Nocardioidaceae bacterium]|nr:SAF domain-containing protein [Nocardioidaceae bacterium]